MEQNNSQVHGSDRYFKTKQSQQISAQKQSVISLSSKKPLVTLQGDRKGVIGRLNKNIMVHNLG